MHWIWRNTIISSVVGFSIFIFVFNSETGQAPNFAVDLLPLVAALILFNMVGVGMYHLSRRYNGLLPWNKNISARFFLEVSSGLVLMALASLVFTALFLLDLEPLESGSTPWQEYWDGAVKFGVISLVVIYVYALVNFSIFSYNQYSVHQIDQLREERNQINLQFEALKTQLSPHFLFNALNTISSLIYKDIQLAEDFIRRLAHTYRYILRTNDQKLISMAAEMEMLKAYYFMQKIKYEDCIEMKEELDRSTLDTVLPPLTLQMLMENALKHNLICDDKKLVLEITTGDDDCLVVKNNIIPKTELLKIGSNLVDRPKDRGSHKIGLSNIRNRYAFFTNKEIEVSKDHNFTVKLPLIKQNIES